MDVKAKSGLIHMQYRALIRRFLDQANGLAKALEVTEDDLWQEYSDYIQISTRIIPENKAVEKVFAKGIDDWETVEKKFRAFLEIDQTIVQEWRGLIRNKDAPDEDALAPEPEAEMEKNASGGEPSNEK